MFNSELRKASAAGVPTTGRMEPFATPDFVSCEQDLATLIAGAALTRHLSTWHLHQKTT